MDLNAMQKRQEQSPLSRIASFLPIHAFNRIIETFTCNFQAMQHAHRIACKLRDICKFPRSLFDQDTLGLPPPWGQSQPNRNAHHCWYANIWHCANATSVRCRVSAL